MSHQICPYIRGYENLQFFFAVSFFIQTVQIKSGIKRKLRKTLECREFFFASNLNENGEHQTVRYEHDTDLHKMGATADDYEKVFA